MKQKSWTMWLAICTLVIVLNSLVHADIQIRPTYLFLDPSHRSVSLTVSNVGDDMRELWVEIKYGYETSNDSGKVIIVVDSLAKNAERSAASWISSFPRRFLLGPSESQTVRIMATPPNNLQDGEYWARVLITSKVQKPAIPALQQGKAQGGENGITLYYRQGIPFHYRLGRLSTGLDVTNISAAPSDSGFDLRMNVQKTGNAAFWGTRTIRLVDKNGKTLMSETRNTGVYTDMLYIDRFKKTGLSPGEYTVEVEFSTDTRQDIRRTMLTHASPIHVSTPLTLR